MKKVHSTGQQMLFVIVIILNWNKMSSFLFNSSYLSKFNIFSSIYYEYQMKKKIPEGKSKQKEKNWSTRFTLQEQRKGKVDEN